MENNVNMENEITLAQLFGVVKKSFKRAIIYVLASAILLGCILLAVRAIVAKDVYTTTISFSQTDENALSKLNSNKANMVNKALAKQFTDGSALDYAEEITNNLTITAIVPEKNEEDEDFIPTKFTISLNKSII